MKKIAIYILLALITKCYLHSQNTDSLVILLNETNKVEDKISILIQLIEYQYSINPDSALVLCSLAEKICSTDTALHTQKAALLCLKGKIYRDLGIQDSASLFLFESLQLYEKLQNPDGIIRLNIAIGDFFRSAAHYLKGIEYLNKAIALCRVYNKNILRAKAYNRLGAVYYEMGTHDYIKNKKLTEPYQNMAIQYIDSSQKFNPDDFEQQYNNWNILGAVYISLGKYKLANQYLLDALEAAKSNNDLIGTLPISRNIAANAMKLKNYKLAEKVLLDAKVLAIQLNVIIYKHIICYELSKVYAEMGDYKKALEYSNLANGFQFQIFNTQSNEIIAKLEAKYDKQKKEIQILQQQEKIKSDNNKLKILLATFFLFFGFLIYILVTRQKQKKLISVLKKQKMEIDSLVEMKDNITATIAHDLKNPLNTILGISKNEEVKQAGKQMLNLVLNFLDVQKLDSAQFKLVRTDFSLNDCFIVALSQVSLLYQRKSIIIENRISTDIIVNADFELIERVFVNLLTNAIKFTNNNGRVIIDVELENQDKLIKPDNRSLIKVSVTDTGIGIPSNKIGIIFERFIQIENRFSGGIRSTGLGLTFCKLAIDAHDSSIGVSSKINEGSTFWFFLPLVNTGIINPNNTNLNNIINTDFQFNFSEIDRMFLLQFTSKLHKFTVYEFSDIKIILDEIKSDENSEIAKWKSSVLHAVKACNEEKYSLLINL